MHQPSSRHSSSLLDSYVQEFQRVLEHGQARKALVNEEALRRADALTRKIVEQSFDPVMALDDKKRIIMANRAAHDVFGCVRPELIGRAVDDVFPGLSNHLANEPTPGNADHHGGVMSHMAGHRQVIEMPIQSGDGRNLVIEIAWSMLNETGPARHVLIARDISALKAQEQWLRHQAQHDALTGLPNRVQLGEALDAAFDRIDRSKGDVEARCALLLLDLDRFKEVNDTLGHHIGDKVLIEFTQRLLQVAGEKDLVTRLGGDEFAVLLPGGSGAKEAGELAQRIVTSIVEPFVFEDGLIGEIGTSIGIALAPDHATDRNTLLQRADIAMYAAKRGSTSIAHYDARLDPNSVRQLTLGGAVRQAVEDQELSLELQPQLQLQNGRIDRVEALLRWHHPTRGLILPAHFVPQSEHSGRIHEITEWSIEEAVRLLQLWHERPLELTLALNISARSFEKRELAPNLLATLEAQRVDPKKLILEITESALLETAGDAGRDLEMLHQAGIRLAIDDFGTGYSSLSLLRNLPIDELKIDQSFVGGLMGPGKDQAIVRSTIDLAHSLGLVVVAEGVEHQEQLDTLRQLSCDYGQGFLIAPAMDMQTFEARYLAQESA